MSWKRSLSFRCVPLIETHSLKSLRKPAPPTLGFCLSYHTHKFCTSKQAQELPATCKLDLSPHIVNPALSNCPSDLIALSFFLWCARQPNYFHDRHAFDHMVIIVNRLTERVKTVKGIIHELESVGCAVKPQAFLLLLRIYWRGGMYRMVFEAFEEMGTFGYEPNTFAHNVIMDVLFKTGQVGGALAVLNDTSEPNFLTYNIAVCNLCKLNDLERVQNVLRTMLRQGYYLPVETFLMTLNCFGKMRRLGEAFQVLAVMIAMGTQFSVGVWSTLIDVFCKSNRLHMAGYLLEKMIEAGCSPNVATYTSLIKGFLESRMFSSAFNILSIMESLGCAPDLVLYNVLIDCFSKIGRHDDAIELFCGLPKQKLRPDSYTFSSILSTMCTSGCSSLSPKLASSSLLQADLVVYNLLLRYYRKAGDPMHVVEIYGDMLDRGFMPDRYTFVELLCGLCGAGRIDEAVKVYRGIVMNHSGVDAHVHTVIIGELIKVGKFHRAIGLFRNAVAEKYPLDVVSYTVALHGLFRGARIEEACTLYSQMKEAGICPNPHTYNVLLSSFCKERDCKMVECILQEMIDSRIRVQNNTFMKMSNFLFRTHYSHSIFNLLALMWSLGLMPEKAKFTMLFEGLSKGVKVDYSPLSFQKYINDLQRVDVSGSDDLSDVAASVG